MTALRTRYRAGEQIAAEVIDGEAVIINLETGIYYSLEGVGGQVWSLIAAGYDLAEAAREIAALYAIPDDHARRDVASLVNRLVEEGIVAPADESAARTAVDGLVARVPYAPPALVVYRDMGDLLALDPPAPGLSTIAWKRPDK